MSEVSEFLNTEQAGKLMNRSPAAMRNLVLRGKVPYRKPGGRLVFLRSELIKWVQQAPGLSLQDIEK